MYLGSLQVPFHFETPELEEIVGNVFLVFILSRPLLELEGAFIICRRQPQLDATRDLAMLAKGYRGIQNGVVDPIQTLDLDNLAQCRLALFDGESSGPPLRSDRPIGIWEALEWLRFC
jgi:hypothetical protein